MSDRGAWSAWAERRWAERQPVLKPEPGTGRAAFGWYLDPEQDDRMRYWDGEKWTDFTTDLPPHIPPSPPQGQALTGPEAKGAIVAILAAAVIGLVMALQNTSLMNGTSNLWLGAVIACAAGVAAWVMRAFVPTWVRVLAVLAALLALQNVLYMEHQMNEKRQEISEIFE